MREFKIWLLYTKYAFQMQLTKRLNVGIFLTGKLVRIGLFVFFLLLILGSAKSLGVYSREQVIFFYLSFNLIDTLAQFLFREIYRFRPLIVSGGFDFYLLKPFNPLLRVLLGGADVLDFIVLIILVLIVSIFGFAYISRDVLSWILYILLVLNALLIAAAFHIFVLGVGILTMAVEHLIFVYRDLTGMMRIPVSLYTEPLRSLFIFVIPVGVMLSFPPMVLMGILQIQYILLAIIFSVCFLGLALWFWNYAIKRYQSASS
jgi:ABC-2 type transport system permease protein